MGAQVGRESQVELRAQAGRGLHQKCAAVVGAGKGTADCPARPRAAALRANAGSARVAPCRAVATWWCASCGPRNTRGRGRRVSLPTPPATAADAPTTLTACCGLHSNCINIFLLLTILSIMLLIDN